MDERGRLVSYICFFISGVNLGRQWLSLLSSTSNDAAAKFIGS